MTPKLMMASPHPLTLAIITVALASMAGSAQAQWWSKGYYSETYETKKPARGYEGFLFPDYYCSYKRYPKRVCRETRSGKEVCKVKGWILEQTCY